MANTSQIAIKAIQRQAQLGRLFYQAGVVRMAVFHYKKVVELYNSASDETKKAATTAYEEAESLLVGLEEQIPAPKPEPIYPHGNVIMLWLYKYKNTSKLRGYGAIR